MADKDPNNVDDQSTPTDPEGRLPKDTDGPSEPSTADILKRLDAFEKQQQGVEKLLGKFKQEQGDFRQDTATIKELLEKQQSISPDGGGDYSDYLTMDALEQRLNENNQQVANILLSSIQNTQNQAILVNEYGLDADGVAEVEAFSKKHGIGDLEAAYLKMNKEDLLGGKDKNSKTKLTKQQLAELRNSGDIVPEAGDGKDTGDTPTRLLREKRFDEFNEWADANPESFKRWQRKKEGVK